MWGVFQRLTERGHKQRNGNTWQQMLASTSLLPLFPYKTHRETTPHSLTANTVYIHITHCAIINQHLLTSHLLYFPLPFHCKWLPSHLMPVSCYIITLTEVTRIQCHHRHTVLSVTIWQWVGVCNSVLLPEDIWPLFPAHRPSFETPVRRLWSKEILVTEKS